MSSNPRSAGDALQTIFSFFLGLMVVAFVGIGLYVFYPGPDQPRGVDSPTSQQDYLAYEQRLNDWRLTSTIILLVVATAIMAISLLRTDKVPVLSNGLLLGGLFTVIFSVIMSLQQAPRWTNFLVITGALVVTIGVGVLKFGRVRRQAVAGPGAGEGAVVQGNAYDERLTAVETKLNAIAAALRS